MEVNMWVNMTFAKVTEAYEKEGLPVLYSKQNMQVMTGAKGFIAGYALMKQNDHSQGCSLSVWESQADAEAFFGSQAYAAMVGSVIQHILGRPERQGWEVSVDMLEAAKG
jgi:heme-degrading monooxygenase HmoA